MNAQMVFDAPGLYTPLLYQGTVIWVRSNRDPFVGVNVPNPENGRLFADIQIYNENGELVQYLEKKEQ